MTMMVMAVFTLGMVGVERSMSDTERQTTNGRKSGGWGICDARKARPEAPFWWRLTKNAKFWTRCHTKGCYQGNQHVMLSSTVFLWATAWQQTLSPPSGVPIRLYVHNCDVSNRLSWQVNSAVTETVPEPETAVFRQNRGEPKPRFFGAKWIRFRLPTFVFIYGTKPMSWFRRGDWRYLQSLQRRLNLPI